MGSRPFRVLCRLRSVLCSRLFLSKKGPKFSGLVCVWSAFLKIRCVSQSPFHATQKARLCLATSVVQVATFQALSDKHEPVCTTPKSVNLRPQVDVTLPEQWSGSV